MKCPACGFEPTLGRPREIDDAEVLQARAAGCTLRDIAKKFGVTHGAIRNVLLRNRPKKRKTK